MLRATQLDALPEQRRNSANESLDRARAVALARQERLRSCHLLLSSWDSTALDARRSTGDDSAAGAAEAGAGAGAGARRATAVATSPIREAHDTPRQLTDVALVPPAVAGATAAAEEAAETVEAAEAVSPRNKVVILPETTTGWKGVVITLVLCVICFFCGYWLRFVVDNGTACVDRGRGNNIDVVTALEGDAESWEYDTKVSPRRSHPAVGKLG